MGRVILVYGAIAGAIVTAIMLLSIGNGVHSVVLGYLSMLVALSMVFVGIKRYRDEQLGGTIRFWTAIAVGLGISAIASLFYALGWEAYLYATDYRFMPEYTASLIEAQRAAGASAQEIAKMSAEMDAFAKSYENPLIRLLFTLSEIAPVALIVTLIAAALLRKPGFLPARAR